LNTKTTTAEKKQNKTTTFEREEKMTKEKSKSVAIFFSCRLPLLDLFKAFRNAFQWQKTRFVKKDLILPSAIFYCVQFHTPKLHTYIQLE